MNDKDRVLMTRFIQRAEETSLGTMLLGFLDVVASIMVVLFLVSPIIGALGSTIFFARITSRMLAFWKTRKLLSASTKRLIPFIITYISIRKGENNMLTRLKELIVNACKLAFGNKNTALTVGAAAGAAYLVFLLLPFELYISLAIAAVLFIVLCYWAITGKIGLEDLNAINERLKKATENKAAKLKEKAYQEKLRLKQKELEKEEREKEEAARREKEKLRREQAALRLKEEEEQEAEELPLSVALVQDMIVPTKISIPPDNAEIK